MILNDLGIFLSLPPMLWCDTVSALALASNHIFHACIKYIEVDYHYIREKVLAKKLKLNFIYTLDQLANIFTKALPSPRFLDLASKLMGVPPLSLRGDVKALIQAEVKAQAQDSKADDRATEADDKVAGKRPVVQL